MMRIEVSKEERQIIDSMLDETSAAFESSEDPGFIESASVYADEIPRRLRVFLHQFRLLEPSGVCVLSGCPLSDQQIGRTPSHWNRRSGRSLALRQEMLLVIFGAVLGDAVGWATQQDGYIVHDILPVKEHEQEQLGTGCKQLLWWHNEDAFHDYRGDYLGMLCLRNPDAVPTTVACMDSIVLPPAMLQVLFEPRFVIRPDESHTHKNASRWPSDERVVRLIQQSYRKIEEMNRNPPRVPVLYGDPRSPYVRLDPYFMAPCDDMEAQAALDTLIAKIEENIQDLVLRPGDCCFIDNYRAVHGRRAFHARYDGNDRWIKRINVVRDLRKSRSSRLSSDSRIIY